MPGSIAGRTLYVLIICNNFADDVIQLAYADGIRRHPTGDRFLKPSTGSAKSVTESMEFAHDVFVQHQFVHPPEEKQRLTENSRET